MKLKLKGAQRGTKFLAVFGSKLIVCIGHSLLKKKSDALTVRFRAILSKIQDVRSRIIKLFGNAFIQAKTEMGAQMKDASFALAVAKVAAHPLDITYVAY